MIGLVIAKFIIPWTVWSGATAQYGDPIRFEVSPKWFEDTESPWTVAGNENRWRDLTDGAENMGLLFAGRTEFPYLVDIRVERRTSEFWAIGTLVNLYTVFTTCRAVADLGDFKSGETSPRVTYGTMYMFEYLNPSSRLSGSRGVRNVSVDPKCDLQQMVYDGGLIFLTSSIKIRPPYISTIQISMDYANGRLRDFDFSRMDAYRIICYVASIGRDFYNIQGDHLVKDFKVKYRVYWERPQLCYQYVNKLCPGRQHVQEACPRGQDDPDSADREWMCFKTRSKVAAVCEHDRGAPLVCDGQVFGIVIMGALPNYCNNLLALPFWVQKVSVFEDWFQSSVKGGAWRSRKFQSQGQSSESTLNPRSRSFLSQLLIPALVLAFTF